VSKWRGQTRIAAALPQLEQLTAAALRGGDVTNVAAGDLEALYRRIV
jgi:hypothetical protein